MTFFPYPCFHFLFIFSSRFLTHHSPSSLSFCSINKHTLFSPIFKKNTLFWFCLPFINTTILCLYPLKRSLFAISTCKSLIHCPTQRKLNSTISPSLKLLFPKSTITSNYKSNKTCSFPIWHDLNVSLVL